MYMHILIYTYTLMKGIAFYCDKTIAQSKQNIKETETDLESVTAKEGYLD